MFRGDEVDELIFERRTTATADTRELENIEVLAGESLRFINLCAPAGPPNA